MENIDVSYDYVGMRKRILSSGCDYMAKTGLKTMVMGLSGGVDSALTASLAREIADRLDLVLLGYSLPSGSNKESEVENARRVGHAFCHGFSEKSIGDRSIDLFGWLEPLPKRPLTKEDRHNQKIRFGNVMARLRMIFLYNMANVTKGLVLSTDNLTELMLGFWTLHGDVGDLGLIQSLWKTEVYGLAGHLYGECICAEEYEKAEALFQAIKATPTDGLGITDSDLDQLEAKSYEEADSRLIEFLKNRVAVYGCPIIERHLRSGFKRENPYNLSRKEIIKP